MEQNDVIGKSWSAQKEATIKIWGEKAHGSHLLHARESHNWESFSNCMHISVMLMSAVTGVISVSDTSFSGLRYVFSVLTISMGGMTSLIKYFKPDEKAIIHKNISQKYIKLYRNVILELGQTRGERKNADEFMMGIKNLNDDIQNEAPMVGSSSIKYYLKHVHVDTKSFPDVVNQHTQPIVILPV